MNPDPMTQTTTWAALEAQRLDPPLDEEEEPTEEPCPDCGSLTCKCDWLTERRMGRR